MELVLRGASGARSVAIFPAAWNPPTVAHLALAEAALGFATEVLLALPRRFPHKEFAHAGFELRRRWLTSLANARSGLGVALSEGGLFLEMARALRRADSRVEQVSIVCGSDAARRFLDWDYASGPGAVEQLQEFSLLVAPRDAALVPPDALRHVVQPLPLDESLQAISSTEIRRRIVAGEAWEHMVPAEITADVGRAYR